jgi:hypothetical protein
MIQVKRYLRPNPDEVDQREDPSEDGKTRWQKMQQELDVETGKGLLTTVKTGGKS